VQARDPDELKGVIEQLKKEERRTPAARERCANAFRDGSGGQPDGAICRMIHNMLTGVIGSLDLIKMRLATGRPEGIERFMEAATTSAQVQRP